jgi:hypothetical protein
MKQSILVRSFLVVCLCTLAVAMPNRAKPIDLFGKENKPNRANDTYQGDIKFMPGDQRFEKGPKGRGLMRTSSTYLWPNGVVAYNIDPNANYSATKIQLILDSMAMINQKTNNCISFVQRTNQVDYVQIRKASGCSSYVILLEKLSANYLPIS